MKKKMMFFGFLMTLATAFTFFEMPELLSTHISSQETNIALANVGANCLGSTYLNKQVQTGHSCYCNESEQWVTKQSCVNTGAGCTEIDCD